MTTSVLAHLDNIKLPQWLSVDQSKTITTFDRTYLLLAISMYMIGLIMVASSSMPVAERLFNDPFHFVERHFIYICLSLVVAVVTMSIPMSIWQKHSGHLLLLGILLLMVVLVIGRTVNGSTRWIVVGPITIQAAEPAKLFFFCYTENNVQPVSTSYWLGSYKNHAQSIFRNKSIFKFI